MSKFLFMRMLLMTAVGLLVSGWLYLSHPSWFDADSAYQMPPVEHATPTALPRPVPPTPTPAMPLVGTVQHLDDIWLTPLRLNRGQGGHGEVPNLGDEFLVILLRINNRSQIDYPVHTGDFQVLDSHGELNAPLVQDFTRRGLREVKLIPDGHTEGTLVFEVPLRDTATLIYQPFALDPSKRKEWLLR